MIRLRAFVWLLLGVLLVAPVHSSTRYVPPSSEPQDLHVFKDHVYFTADDGIHGRELWRCDRAGVVELVADLTTGSASSKLSKFSSFDELLLFRLDPEGGASELWGTDGTATGTRRIKTFNGDIGEGFDALCGIWEDGRAFIRVVSGSAALWVSDGTESGTYPLPMTTASGSPVGVDFYGLLHEGAFAFSAEHPTRGPLLARCDRDGKMVTEIDDLAMHATEFLAMDAHRLLFCSADKENGQELFISGGTAEYTNMLRDIGPGPFPGAPSGLTLIATPGERPLVIFSADDNVHGREPWITDGTTVGTRMIADVYPGPKGSRPAKFIVYEDRVVFTALEGDTGKEMWSVARPYESAELLGDLRVGANSSDPYALCAVPKRGVYFSALDGVSGEELYLAEPSRRQVDRVFDIYPGEKSSYPYDTVVLGDYLVFAATDPVHGRELWCIDDRGQARILADIYSDASTNPSSSPRELTPAGERLYFVADDLAHGPELWVSDGEGAGTRLVKDIFPGPAGSAPMELTPAGALLYFTAEDGVNGFRLWSSDGTGEGTRLISLEASRPQQLTALGPRLFFAAQREGMGVELWVTGPENPASIVRDIAIGDASSEPRNLVVFQEKLYFRADDGIHGEELWRSDGTAEGTLMVRDIISEPFEEIRYGALAPTGSTLYLSVDSPSLGTELWRYRGQNERPTLVRDLATWDGPGLKPRP